VETDSQSEWVLPKLKQETAAESALASIRSAIFDGKFRPGDALRELALAQQIGVSQATIREALFRLERTGLVAKVPNVGTYVTRLSDEKLRERISVRMTLETMAFVKAAPRMDESLFEKLESVVCRCAGRDDGFLLSEAELEFHSAIWELSGNQTLCRMLRELTAPLFAFAELLIKSGRHPRPEFEKSHRELINVIRDPSPERVSKAIRDHIRHHQLGFFDLDAS